MKRKILKILLLILFLTVNFTKIYAGRAPEISDKHKGATLKTFEAKDINGKNVSLSDFKGKPLVIDIFASWCPPCQYDLKHLEKLYPDFLKQGVQIIGILADPAETPETVEGAVRHLFKNPLPFPVWLINDSIKKAISYEGFPAVYFIDANGEFSTTVFGPQEIDVFQEVVKNIIPNKSGQDSTGIKKGETPGAFHKTPDEQKFAPFNENPLSPLVPVSWKMWHPKFVHFPIVLLIAEAFVIFLYRLKPRQELIIFSKWLLIAAVISFVFVIYSGIRDVGVQLGGESPFIDGLQDRIENFSQWRSTISLHVIYAVILIIITLIRFLWRLKMKEQAVSGRFPIVFLLLTIIGLIVMFGAGQVGSSVFHY